MEVGDDPVLNQILLIAINSMNTNRPIYTSVLEEPSFYQRYIKKWITEGLEEKAKIEKLQKQGEIG